jgi:hypothetical protein
VAAHITAASVGGPRYDPSLSTEQRSSASNGLWLCQTHAKEVDNDLARFGVAVLNKWKADAEAEARSRVGKLAASSPSGVFMDVSVMTEAPPAWRSPELTVIRYTIARTGKLMKINNEMGYFDLFEAGGPITPLEYVMSPSRCPFFWSFPALDFKVLNDSEDPIFLTEIVFDIEESRIDTRPLLTIKKDTQRRFAGELHLVNEGGCSLRDLRISFHLMPGEPADYPVTSPPYPHSLVLPTLDNEAHLDLTDAFRKEGVDIDGLILAGNGEWHKGMFVVSGVEGLERRMTESEYQAWYEELLGPFKDEAGTLSGEIEFEQAGKGGVRQTVSFSAPAHLANLNRVGIPRPPTYSYDSAFEAHKTGYQRRVQISQSVDPGEADRFLVRVAIPRSSTHRFCATLRDVRGVVWQSIPIEMNCFVPRSLQDMVSKSIASRETPSHGPGAASEA